MRFLCIFSDLLIYSFHVNKYTVYHLEEQKRKTGSVDLQTWRRGRKALLNSADKARIAQCIAKNRTISLEEMRTQLGLKVSISTMSRVVRALGFRVKKSVFQQLNGSVPDVQAKRIKWQELKLAIEPWRFVFLDESGVNIGMRRRYGRAVGKTRVHCSAPLNVPTSQTVLASVRLNGQITYTMYPGGTTGERFLDYLKNVLIPTLHKGDIVVMDNMRSHHVKGVEEVLRAAGMIPLYLPPYSPDLNPIEMMWSKMKAILRKLGCNIAELLPQMVAEALALVSPEDCWGWFAADGY